MAVAQKTINDPNVEKRTVSSFHGIDVGTGIELMLTEESTEELAVSAAKTEFRDKIATQVENGVLKIYGDTGSKFKGEEMSTSNCSNCSVIVSTGAIVFVKAENELQAKASTGGSVKYKGNPSVKEIKKHSGGTVIKI